MDWRIKGAVQKVLGYVPGGSRIHLQLQRRVGGLRDFGRECDMKVDDWSVMTEHLGAVGIAVEGATMLEIGTGWYPTLPLCFYLAGVGRVVTIDRSRLLDEDLLRMLADRLAAHVGLIAEAGDRSRSEVEANQRALAATLDSGSSLALATGGVVDYRAPADAAVLSLSAGTIDVVFSNSVLEHMTVSMIQTCFAEARRLLRPGGVMVHSINCGDHYAHSDPSITQLHYLQFSQRDWGRWNNAFLYQNRLRAVDFMDLARRAGFTIEVDTSRVTAQRLSELDAIAVAPCFAHYTREQLAITTLDFVARVA